MNTDEILGAFRLHGNFHEIHEVRKFKGFRTNSAGEQKEVFISLKDLGQNSGYGVSRYSCSVVDEDGKKAYGNPDKNITGAIENVHWHELD